MIKQGKKRDEKSSVQNLKEPMEYGEKSCDIIVHTGDLIDFISKPCVEFAKEYLKNEKVLFIAGNHEYAKYDDTYSTIYGYCSALLVSAGQTVKQGQIIAKVGSTGYSTGNHLHFEIIQNGVRVDALMFYNSN